LLGETGRGEWDLGRARGGVSGWAEKEKAEQQAYREPRCFAPPVIYGDGEPGGVMIALRLAGRVGE
jgi:hypothetical protein